MTSTPPVFRPASLAALVAASLLAACGGGGGGDTNDNAEALAYATTQQAPLTSDEVPAPGGAAAPEPIQLQRELASSVTCTAPSYAKPRIAAWDMSRDDSASRQALLAKFAFAVTNMAPADLGTFASGLKALNPNIKLAKYINVADLKPQAGVDDESHGLVQAADANHWWLTTADGKPASWTGGATTALNTTTWAQASASGQRWPQFKAQFDTQAVFADAPAVEYAFSANTLVRPRVSADWKRIGSDLAPSDSGVQAAMRAGYAAYWSALRTASPNLKVMAGTDSDLSAPEFKGLADAAYLDGMIGRPWSRESWAGWEAMLHHYRSTLANVKSGKAVVFSVYGATPTDYAALRYGMASALLDDGLFMFRPVSGDQAPALYDEYLAPLGKALDAPPAAAASNGIWMRRYENGLVLVNPQSTSATIDVGSGYKRLSGTQDPATNNGQTQRSVTLGARQGLLMLKVPVPCTESPTVGTFAKPKVAALDYSRNTTEARKALLAKFDYVILSLGQSLGPTAIRDFVSGVKKLNPATKVGQYSILNEIKCSLAADQEKYPLWQEVNRNDWWLRDAAGQRVQWNTVYGACDINISTAMPRNAAGESWAQFKWQFDRSTLFGTAPFDFVFSDNTFGKTRSDADWLRTGVNQPKGDPAASAALRQGHVAYWNAVRSTDPQLKLVGNADNDLSAPEYQGVLDGAFLEGAIGKSYSRENWAGWQSMMDYYRAAVHHTRNPDMVFLNVYADPADYATVRYGLASSMLEDGHFLHLPAVGTMQPSWFDEFNAPMGTAAEPPPTAPAQNGIWLRRYANGLVLVNPSKTASASINVGAGYKRLSGTQDPGVNNGQAQSTVTLGPRQGLLMIRQ